MCVCHLIIKDYLLTYLFPIRILLGVFFWQYVFVLLLQAVADAGILQRVKRIAGSSAGAICAGLLAVGCMPQDIANVFKCNIKWLFHGIQLYYTCHSPLTVKHILIDCACFGVQHIRDILKLTHSKNFLKMLNLETSLLLLMIQTFNIVYNVYFFLLVQ